MSESSDGRQRQNLERLAVGPLFGLKSRYMLHGGSRAMGRGDEIRTALQSRTTGQVIGHGLHEFLDWLQFRFIDLTREIGMDFFGHEPSDDVRKQAREQT